MISNNLSKDWCNWAKLVAALLVAVSHYSTCIVINNHWSDSSFLRFWCQGGNIGVAIFFFLSGYGLMESEKKHHLGVVEFLKKRLSNVYLPVLLVSVCWIPFYYLFVSNETAGLTFGSVLYDVLWDFKDCVLWFVKILILLYALFTCCCAIRTKGYAVASHILFVGGVCGATFLAHHVGYPFVSVPLFCLGVYASTYKDKYILHQPISVVLVIALMVVNALIYLVLRDNHFAHGVTNGIIVLVMLYSIYGLNKITPPIRLSGYMIDATFMVYLVHFKVLDFLVSNWGHIPFWE